MIKLSERIGRVEPSATLAITARAKAMKKEGIDVIGFGAGEPDFDAPDEVKEALKRAVDQGKTRYTPASGIPELRQGIAADYAHRGREVDPSEVIVTVGGKQALFNATQVLFDPGDAVIIPTPCWVSYPAQLHLAGAAPILVNTTAEGGHKLDPEVLTESLARTQARGLILCSPSNPTGGTYTAEELRAVGKVLAGFPDVVVLFDAIYDRIYYDGEIAPDLVAVCPELSDRVITFNGFSKTYSMTGLRLGYAIGPKEVIAAMGTLQSQSTSNATSIVQYAAVEALKIADEEIAGRREAFRRRRDLIVGLLREIDGVECEMPTGAFYAFPDFSSFLGAEGFADDLELAAMLLNDAHVAAVPGSAFGAPGHLRLSYALSEEEITEGIRRIAEALRR